MSTWEVGCFFPGGCVQHSVLFDARMITKDKNTLFVSCDALSVCSTKLGFLIRHVLASTDAPRSPLACLSPTPLNRSGKPPLRA